jgi:hypothetical protein
LLIEAEGLLFIACHSDMFPIFASSFYFYLLRIRCPIMFKKLAGGEGNVELISQKENGVMNFGEG